MKHNKLIPLTLFLPLMLTSCNIFGITIKTPAHMKKVPNKEQVIAALGERYSISFVAGSYNNGTDGGEVHEEANVHLVVSPDKIYSDIISDEQSGEAYIRKEEGKWYQYTDTNDDDKFDHREALDDDYQYDYAAIAYVALGGTEAVMYDTEELVEYKSRSCTQYVGTFAWNGMGVNFSYTQTSIFDNETGICLKHVITVSGNADEQFDCTAFLEVNEIVTDDSEVNSLLASYDARIELA